MTGNIANPTKITSILTAIRFSLVAAVVALCSFAAKSNAGVSNSALYPTPNDLSMRSHEVRATVDGQEAFVFALMHKGITYRSIPNVSSDFLSFEFRNGPVQVRIFYNFTTIYSAKVYTHGRVVQSSHDSNSITFIIDNAGIYAVEVNGDVESRGPVYVFANRPEVAAPDSSSSDIVFKAGTITNAGVIHADRPNQRIYIPGGAIVRGSIEVDHVAGVTISGSGILLFDDETASIAGINNYSPILAVDARNLRINGLVVVVAPTSYSSGPGGSPVAPWAVHILRSTEVTINQLKVLNGLRDGIDIDGSDHVRVQNGLVQSHDDSLCIKSTNFGLEGGASHRSVADVTFRRMMIVNEGTGAALQIGIELHAPEVTRISYRDIDILQAYGTHTAAISITNGDSADVHNILYDNVRVLSRPGALIRLTIVKDAYRPDQNRGKIRDIVFKNIQIKSRAVAPSAIVGFDAQHLVENVRFDNFESEQDFQTDRPANLTVRNAASLIIKRKY